MRSVGLLLLRIVGGVTLMAHGYPKLFGGPGRQPPPTLVKLFGSNYPAAHERSGPTNFGQALTKMEVPAPQLAAYLSGLAEFGGGLAIATGFATRLAALPVAVNMGVAIRKAHWKVGFYGQGGYEFPLLLGAAALTLLFTGPGWISIDALIAGPHLPHRH